MGGIWQEKSLNNLPSTTDNQVRQWITAQNAQTF